MLENEFGDPPEISGTSEDDNSDDEISMSKFNKKFKIGEQSPAKSKKKSKPHKSLFTP